MTELRPITLVCVKCKEVDVIMGFSIPDDIESDGWVCMRCQEELKPKKVKKKPVRKKKKQEAKDE